MVVVVVGGAVKRWIFNSEGWWVGGGLGGKGPIATYLHKLLKKAIHFVLNCEGLGVDGGWGGIGGGDGAERHEKGVEMGWILNLGGGVRFAPHCPNSAPIMHHSSL